MKKLPFILIFLCLSLTVSAENKLTSLINQYKGHEDFEVINLGSFGTSIVKNLIRLSSDDAESRELLKVLDGVRRVSIVDFEDCDNDTKRKFRSKVEAELNGSEVLMEIKDSDDIVKLYGIFDDKTSSIKDFVMYTPSDCALICLFGSIPMDSIKKLSNL